MFSAIPIPYKLAGGLLLILGVFGAGYYKGYSGQHDELTSYKAQVTQTAADQKAAAIAKDKQNEEITNNIVQTWKSDHDRLSAVIAGMRNTDGRSAVSQTADSKQGNDDIIAFEGGTCSRSFYNKALDAELLLETWQEWALEHGITVE